MNQLGSPNAATLVHIAREPVHAARLALLWHWLSALSVLFVHESKAEMSGTIYVGVGDQFDDDRRRIHVAR